MKVNEAIFRDYDIRGIVGEDLSDQFAEVFGKAYGTFLKRKGVSETFVGQDARESSPAYYEACINGLVSTGVDVIKVGLVTSPMLYWTRKYYRKEGGVSITASHNPPEYNGFKPCFGIGAMFGVGLQELKRLMISEDFEHGEGKISEKEIFEEYKKDVLSRVKISKPMNVIVDAGNATGGLFAPKVISGLGVKVTELFCEVDPKFPNHPPDPVDPRAYPQIIEMIKKGGYDMGLLFDGDVDRLGVVTADGEIVRGDQITALCARKILSKKPGAKILFEIQCSKSATDDVEGHGGTIKLIRVGHSYIEQALVSEHAALAGETSGHIFFEDNWYGFDDALYAACRLLEYVAESGKTLKELVDSLPKYISTPQTRIFAPDDRKFEIVEELKKYFQQKGEKVLTIDGVRLEWDDGWAVIRASNTQPQLTLRAEAMDEKRLAEIKRIVEESLVPYKKDGIEVEWGKVH